MRRALACIIVLVAGLTAANACLLEVTEYPVGDITAAPTSGPLGASCGATADCEAGLECMLDLGSIGAIAGGLCAKYCMSLTDCPISGDCADGLCVLRCAYGDGDASKCLARSDAACMLTTKAVFGEVCVPSCVDDQACEPGKYCHPGTGTCVDTRPTGDPPGHPCAVPIPQTAPSSCRGVCQDGTCIELCVIGRGGCELDPSWGNLTLECVAQGPSGRVGDLGMCRRRCDCDSDCTLGAVCSHVEGGNHYCLAGNEGGVLCG